MDLYDLSFAKIILLREDIAEVIVDEGIEMDMAMTEEYHQFLLAHLRSPFSLLVNKINSYSYDLDAQKNIATLKEINAMAVVSYNRATKNRTKHLASIPRTVDWKIKIYSSRAEALAWLEAEQDAVNSSSGLTKSA